MTAVPTMTAPTMTPMPTMTAPAMSSTGPSATPQPEPVDTAPAASSSGAPSPSDEGDEGGGDSGCSIVAGKSHSSAPVSVALGLGALLLVRRKRQAR